MVFPTLILYSFNKLLTLIMRQMSKPLNLLPDEINTEVLPAKVLNLIAKEKYFNEKFKTSVIILNGQCN